MRGTKCVILPILTLLTIVRMTEFPSEQGNPIMKSREMCDHGRLGLEQFCRRKKPFVDTGVTPEVSIKVPSCMGSAPSPRPKPGGGDGCIGLGGCLGGDRKSLFWATLAASEVNVWGCRKNKSEQFVMKAPQNWGFLSNQLRELSRGLGPSIREGGSIGGSSDLVKPTNSWRSSAA